MYDQEISSRKHVYVMCQIIDKEANVRIAISYLVSFIKTTAVNTVEKPTGIIIAVLYMYIII